MKPSKQLQCACVKRVRNRLQSLTEDAGSVSVELTYDELNHIINAISHYGTDTKKFPGRMSPAGIMKKLRMAFHDVAANRFPSREPRLSNPTDVAGYAGRNPDASFIR